MPRILAIGVLLAATTNAFMNQQAKVAIETLANDPTLKEMLEEHKKLW